MSIVRPKKHLGQHFLKDLNIAKNIAEALTGHGDYQRVLEVGPGTGVLTQFLLSNDFELHLIEIDRDSVGFLNKNFPELTNRIVEGDFLKVNVAALEAHKFAIIGNFPYNISSQIFFKVLDQKQHIPEVVCMIQKEVADRLVSPPGSKAYGILSVLLQAYYDIEYLFTVEPGVFNPPPKVKSAVIRLKRNLTESIDCDERLFRRIVKQAFQMRRKTLRNALKPINLPEQTRTLPIMDSRAEQLSVNEFVNLTNEISRWQKKE